MDDCFAVACADERGEPVEEAGQRLQEQEGDQLLPRQQLVDYLHDRLHAAQFHKVSDDLGLVCSLCLAFRFVAQALLYEFCVVPEKSVEAGVAARDDVGSVENFEVGEEVGFPSALQRYFLRCVDDLEKLRDGGGT